MWLIKPIYIELYEITRYLQDILKKLRQIGLCIATVSTMWMQYNCDPQSIARSTWKTEVVQFSSTETLSKDLTKYRE